MYKLLLGLAGLAAVGLGWHCLPPAEADGRQGRDQVPPVKGITFKPNWQVGDQWVVETIRQQQVFRNDARQQPPQSQTQWLFTVKGIDKLRGRPCYTVQVDCLVSRKEKQHVVTLWADQETLTLRQLQTKLPVPGGFQTVTESYSPAGGQPAPVIAPLAVVPLELPVFLPSGAKALNTFQYESISGPAGVKGPGDVSFAYLVEQNISEPPLARVKALVAEPFQKGLDEGSLLAVELKSPGQPRVRQLWRKGLPWPVFSTHGATSARLVRVIPANANIQPQPEEK